VDHPDEPVVKGAIKMFCSTNTLFRTTGDTTEMMDIEHFDMKGSMPASLMNMSIASETNKEMKNMLRVVLER